MDSDDDAGFDDPGDVPRPRAREETEDFDFDFDDEWSETTPPSGRPWIPIAAIFATIVVAAALIGLAIDNSSNDDTDTAATADTTTTSRPATTTSSIDFSTVTTAPAFTPATETTLSTPTTSATATTAAAAGSSTNRQMTVEATWVPDPPLAGEEVVFDVRVVDPDAGPINECGGSPPGGFGDSPYGPGCQVSCTAPSTRQRSEASYRYVHTYSQPGTYTVRFSYQSAGGCTSNNPGASQRTLSFQITVN